MKKEDGQGRGKQVELPVVVGDALVSRQIPQISIFTPEDTEYQNYQDLLQGYFKIFARWQEIFLEEKYHLDSKQYHRNSQLSEPIQNSYNKHGFRVSQT